MCIDGEANADFKCEQTLMCDHSLYLFLVTNIAKNTKSNNLGGKVMSLKYSKKHVLLVMNYFTNFCWQVALQNIASYD